MQHMADRLRNKANAQHICPWMTCKPVDNSFHSFISDKLTDSLIQLNQLLYKLHFVNFIFNKGRRCWWGWWWWWCFSCCHQTHDTSFECNSNVPLTLLSTGFRYRGCYNTDTMLSLRQIICLKCPQTDNHIQIIDQTVTKKMTLIPFNAVKIPSTSPCSAQLWSWLTHWPHTQLSSAFIFFSVGKTHKLVQKTKINV